MSDRRLEIETFVEFRTDTFNIKLRDIRSSDGRITKAGMIIEIPYSFIRNLPEIPDNCEYPIFKLKDH